MFQIKTILNARDFSPPSADACAVACDLARQNDARLIFLHVADQPIVSYLENASELSSEELQHKLFETLRPARPEEADLHIEHRVVEGNPVEQILAAAEDSGCDLIVVGRRAAGVWSRLFERSITEEVIRRAPCSVLVAKARADVPEPFESAKEVEPAPAPSTSPV